MEYIKKALLKSLFKESIKDSIIDVVASCISDYETENIAFYVTNPDFELLYPGDYFKTKCNILEYNNLPVNLDTLIDLNLSENGFVYGQVISADSYSNTFNPYYYKMKCNLFIHDDNLKVIKKQIPIDTHKLIKINKSEIKYFEYGQDITSTT